MKKKDVGVITGAALKNKQIYRVVIEVDKLDCPIMVECDSAEKMYEVYLDILYQLRNESIVHIVSSELDDCLDMVSFSSQFYITHKTRVWKWSE